MKTIYSPKHVLHSGNHELVAGEIVPAFEMPSRADFILDRLKAVALGPIIDTPAEHDIAIAKRVHAPDFIDFMPTIWPRWVELGHTGAAIPFTWPTRGLRGDVPPKHLHGLLGYYSFDGGATFVEGTWEAIKSSFDVAISAAELIKAGETSAYALCRPPGHHAGSNFMGGYCFINNIAVAAQWFLDQGAKRVSILDVDYHHGNGTQQIFYSRSDVQVVNLHADPLLEYPYFLGHKDETGEGAGEGFNINYPMPFGTTYAEWGANLDDACAKIDAYGPDVVLVSLGVDTFEKDPISKFKLKREDYPKIGARIAKLNRPTLFVQEGGYAVEDIGFNAVGVLTGFAGR
ncbi:histone deacetylase family protein [Oryzibacter oryziterrae]|uniref:histone deacetylase family protein n=1 Tax=Oryzibacter oryziterrae TaxID=2766474 RepID=UPI001F3A8910|nr:histone deacetylase family protein [Oryzibacter oryziterrae]